MYTWIVRATVAARIRNDGASWHQLDKDDKLLVRCGFGLSFTAMLLLLPGAWATDAQQPVAVSVGSGQQAPPTPMAAEQSSVGDVEYSLIHEIRGIERDDNPLSRKLIAPLLRLGRLYASNDRCPEAIDALTSALNVSNHVDGLLQPQQVQYLEPIIECYVALNRQTDLDRSLRYAMLVNETKYGRDSLGFLPALDQAARWYEAAGRYLSARQLQGRALDIVQEHSNAELQAVEPLRGIARAFRLEYMYGLHEADQLEASASSQSRDRRPDWRGERALRRALEILMRHPDAARAQRVATLLDLGDWYQMLYDHRSAVEIYRDAWRELTQPGAPGPAVLDKPVPIFYRSDAGQSLRRPPPAGQSLRRQFVEFEFGVTQEGRVVDVRVKESDAPEYLQRELAASLRLTRFRPRFVAGQPVDTPGLHHRQGVYVID